MTTKPPSCARCVPGLPCHRCFRGAERQSRERDLARIRAARYRASKAKIGAAAGVLPPPSGERLALTVAPRVAIVRTAKAEKEARGLGTILTDAELDAVLPPVECQRTRVRLAKGAAWRSQDPMFRRTRA
jgi:hypothetical protein